ncbi:uncharacterized protein LOC108089913 [Drosophila ficusphila]|uniref:uncharacterized protein LOC108089913 n=1 Tax=Drosophila ficusphila TaxID=30025 RepID=UPI0007E788EF|nr:uncharacterized protein LOC108089913 [Drosophila ficusphila]
MAQNIISTRKSKSTRLEMPPMSPTYRQYDNDYGLPKDKIPKMSKRRSNKSSMQPFEEPPIFVNDKIKNHCDHLPRPSKNPIKRTEGSVSMSSKYQSRDNMSNISSKTVDSSVTTGSFRKRTPNEIKEQKESKEIKVNKEAKQIQDFRDTKEFKEFKEHREHKTGKEPRESKEPKEIKEHKESRVKGGAKSPTISHRTSRHNTNHTKNYFDKYLKFAFDLTTPEGVRKLEEHFFPNQPLGQDPNATGSSNLNRQE